MKSKKAALGFEQISSGMITFIGFFLISILAILLISITTKTSIVCPETEWNGACVSCNTTGTTTWAFNASEGNCYNTSLTNATKQAYEEYTGASYNASKDLRIASLIPPQFASIIIIVIVTIGLLGMLAYIGYSAYQRLK